MIHRLKVDSGFVVPLYGAEKGPRRGIKEGPTNNTIPEPTGKTMRGTDLYLSRLFVSRYSLGSSI